MSAQSTIRPLHQQDDGEITSASGRSVWKSGIVTLFNSMRLLTTDNVLSNGRLTCISVTVCMS